KNPPGNAKALSSSVSITLMVNGTLASELRTRFWPSRLMYSVTTGSCTILAVCSTCCEYARPMATCLSSEYQLPIPLLQPTLRLPMASMLFRVLGLGAFLSGFSGAGGFDSWAGGFDVAFGSCDEEL